MTARRDVADLTHRDAAWSGLRVLVAGLGISGFAAADALAERGAQVVLVDAAVPAPDSAAAGRAQILEVLDVEVRTGAEAAAALPGGRELDLVVTSPGWRPDQPLLAAAAAAGIPVWGEVELAWRMRAREGAAPWLTITGTNGKTTTVQMLAAILRAAGLRATSAGNVGTPILEAVLHPEPYDVIAVELSSFQLHWSSSLRPLASVCLNIAPDHIDWHGSLADYEKDKGKVYANTEIACVYNVQDPATERLVEQAEVIEGCRAIGFTLGVPARSMVGLVDDILADRAFVEDRATSAVPVASLGDLEQNGIPAAPHVVANALAAAALARAYGVHPHAVAAGLRDFVPEPHRVAYAGEVAGVRFVDDSKATNPHAASASLAAYEHIVWIAGGLLKGAEIDDLVERFAGRLRGAVLIGADRARIAESLARHAPDLPVVDLADTDTGAMDRAVVAAARLAQPGDVVLLAPAAASMDMFANYGARGDAFTAAVARLTSSGE
ncbi:UDP-N-acetylmuramoyl-L-alanine--D-glutamate ligase [Nostocoides vanveenii]|jgi:UDP-N-acetylmuramoylalanine--D-glutamate ligase|uniref:UDP-N-acetylmuramoylalanine--D-glutamate ligase n=1 Tax=Nostocoides vanveenii TaxID=330835 RepID=A0ABP4WWA8_9MICO